MQHRATRKKKGKVSNTALSEEQLRFKLLQLEVLEKERRVLGLGAAYDDDMDNISRDMRGLSDRIAKLETPDVSGSD